MSEIIARLPEYPVNKHEEELFKEVHNTIQNWKSEPPQGPQGALFKNKFTKHEEVELELKLGMLKIGRDDILVQ